MTVAPRPVPSTPTLPSVFGSIRPRPRWQETRLLILVALTLMIGSISLSLTLTKRFAPYDPGGLVVYLGALLAAHLAYVLAGRRSDQDGVVDVAAEGGYRVEVERPPGGRLAARRLEDDEPTERTGRLAGSRAEVSHERADDAREEHIQQGEEQESDDPDDGKEPVHQGTSPATSTTMTLSPSSIRSPSPSTSSPTVTPLTRDPFVLPRSVYTRVPRRPTTRA